MNKNKMTGLPLTQDRLFAMGRICRDSLAGRAAFDFSPMNSGRVRIISAYETPENEKEQEFYSVQFETAEGKKFTFHKEYTCNLRLVPETD